MQTATALVIHMGSAVQLLLFKDSAVAGFAASFFGPGQGGSADVVLALTRPIRFDKISCAGPATGLDNVCTVSWIGDN